MGCSFVTLGQTPDDAIDVGETIIRVFRYKDPAGTTIDLNGATVSIHSADPVEIKTYGVVTIDEDDDGSFVRFVLDHTHAEQYLRPRGTNWFRLYVDFGNGQDDATPQIGIKLR